jgi:hypothetical protein
VGWCTHKAQGGLALRGTVVSLTKQRLGQMAACEAMGLDSVSSWTDNADSTHVAVGL